MIENRLKSNSLNTKSRISWLEGVSVPCWSVTSVDNCISWAAKWSKTKSKSVWKEHDLRGIVKVLIARHHVVYSCGTYKESTCILVSDFRNTSCAWTSIVLMADEVNKDLSNITVCRMNDFKKKLKTASEKSHMV